MALRLRVANGARSGSEITVADELLLGREVEGAGALADDLQVSRRHARIARTEAGGLLIEDLGSRNGTFVNGQPVTEARRVDARDRITIGTTAIDVIPVRAEGEAGADRAAPRGNDRTVVLVAE